eukprot:COSAG06_NODE_6781_length_2786_cov_1.435058_4_plen_135_part_00
MSDHVADDISIESDDDEDESTSASDYATSSSAGDVGADSGSGEPAPGTSGSSGGPYSALTRSLGASPRGDGFGGSGGGMPLAGISFNQQQLSSDSEGLSSRDSPAKRPRDGGMQQQQQHNAHHDSSDEGEIEFG